MNEFYSKQTVEDWQGAEEPKLSSDAMTKQGPSKPVPTKWAIPASMVLMKPQPWPPLCTSKLQSISGLFFLLETTRSRGINSRLIQAVLALHRREKMEVYLSVLAGDLGTTTASVTNIADRLEHLGLATRTWSGADRRKTAIVLSPHGQSLVVWIRQILCCSSGSVGSNMLPDGPM